ncbi:dihydroneopterin aldolase [Paenibacillus apiarius]|uniref:dihydroneopterin aldolase n=1 Tax=Paenibacillus apiarius TaxID=46240 RepID=UPI0019806D28|nr:dihydroneopterin aldolase [Paenibacillus apiarius]MBN3524372.1 dihydroneopterin aldolase [Paenibacillus apiarius]
MIKTKVAGYDRMQLHRMEFFGRHGVFQEERALGQLWYVDLDLQIDLRQAGVTDDLSDSVNYADIFYLVKSIVEGQSFQLVEALTERIAAALLEAYPKINEATVRVTKPHPPLDIHFQGLTVEMTRVRDRDERHVDESGA